MQFYERFEQECIEHNTSPSAVLKKLHLSTSKLTAWKNGSTPNSDYVIQIADYFNISIDYLLTGKLYSYDLTNEEKELIEYYRQIPFNEQQRLLGRAEHIAELALQEKISEAHIKITNTRFIRHSLFKVSAGTGYWLSEDDEWEQMEIPDTSYTAKADYCLTISGDSMEPDFHNGDIVLVHDTPEIDIGQIGIFIVENSGFIKKLGADRLISINAEYEDILFSDYNPEDIYCRGLVIGTL